MNYNQRLNRLAPMAWIAVLTMSGVAIAQPLIVDQQNDPSTSISYSGSGTLGQGFTPNASFLAAIDLRLDIGTAFPSTGILSTVVIHEGGIGGQIIGSATTFIPSTVTPGQRVIRYTLGVSVAPGTLHVVEWDSPLASSAMWVGSDMNPYPGGSMYGDNGAVIPNQDLNFLTYTIASNWVRGDCLNDGATNVSDPVALLGHLFPQGALTTLACEDACDINDDGSLNLQDPVVLLNWLFVPNSPPPAAPVSCGMDPTADALDCLSFVGC